MKLTGLDQGERSALLISECQQGIIGDHPGALLASVARERHLTRRIAALASAFREAGLPVFHCTLVPPRGYVGWVNNSRLARMIMKADNIVEGSPGAEIHPDLAPPTEDIIVSRAHGMSMFHGTELEWLLRARGIETCVIVGVSTNIAIPGSAHEAVARFFNVVIPEDCTAGATPDSHAMQMTMHLPLLATVTTSDQVARCIKGVQAT